MGDPSSITNLAQRGESGVSARACSENGMVKHIFQIIFRQRDESAYVVAKIGGKQIADKVCLEKAEII